MNARLGASIGVGALAMITIMALFVLAKIGLDRPPPTIVLPTRTPRPTFTAVPSPTTTQTTTPLPTPTRKIIPTRRPPTLTPTKKPPTPQALANPGFRWRSANKGCEHSGQTFIQGTAYHGQDRVNGITVILSGGGPDGSMADSRVTGTDGDGFYSMIVNAYGASPGQKRWVWVVENGKRASDVIEFNFNDLKETDPASCWRGWVDFVQLY